MVRRFVGLKARCLEMTMDLTKAGVTEMLGMFDIFVKAHVFFFCILYRIIRFQMLCVMYVSLCDRIAAF